MEVQSFCRFHFRSVWSYVLKATRRHGLWSTAPLLPSEHCFALELASYCRVGGAEQGEWWRQPVGCDGLKVESKPFARLCPASSSSETSMHCFALKQTTCTLHLPPRSAYSATWLLEPCEELAALWRSSFWSRCETLPTHLNTFSSNAHCFFSFSSLSPSLRSAHIIR